MNQKNTMYKRTLRVLQLVGVPCGFATSTLKNFLNLTTVKEKRFTGIQGKPAAWIAL
jgi:hypothetical protein